MIANITKRTDKMLIKGLASARRSIDWCIANRYPAKVFFEDEEAITEELDKRNIKYEIV